MSKLKLSVLGLSYSQTQAGAYALVLAEEEGKRRIPIIIGGFEAQAIAIELEGLKPPRPLTHDLLLGFANAYNIQLEEVNIYKLEEGIFHSELICNDGNERIRIDARTSDAVALALRFKCPIYTTEEIISKAGINLDIDIEAQNSPEKDDEATKESMVTQFEELDDDELHKALDKAISDENYEEASKLRDVIKRREDKA